MNGYEYIVWYSMILPPAFLIIYIIIYELKQREKK